MEFYFKIFIAAVAFVVNNNKHFASAQFVPSGSCGITDCDVFCSTGTNTNTLFRLQNLVSSGSQFRVFSSSVGLYDYSMILPICKRDSLSFGNLQNTNTLQYNYYNGGTYGLGNYFQSSTFQIGTYYGATALSVMFIGGSSYSCYFPRQTLVYLMCDASYAITSPRVVFAETSGCMCKLFIFLLQ